MRNRVLSLLTAVAVAWPVGALQAVEPPSMPTPSEQADPFGNPYAGQRRTIDDGYTYTTNLVEARLGPHRYRFPANFYYDQIGPDFQGGVALVLLWPDLQPAPPGVNFHDDDALFGHVIHVRLEYLDKVPVGTYLERLTKPLVRNDDPIETIRGRIRGSAVHGLTPYYLDFARLRAWMKRAYGDVPAAGMDPASSLNEDWYLAYGPKRQIRTFIRCGSHEMPDGIVFDGARVVEVTPPVMLCTHHFTVPEKGLSVELGYPRALLHDWARVEARVRQLLRAAHVDANQGGRK